MSEPVLGSPPPSVVWKIRLGIVLILLAGINGARYLLTEGGDSLGVVILGFVGAYLIAAGRQTQLPPDCVRLRRRIWFRYLGIGFLVMVALVVGLATIEQFTAAGVVKLAYWFGWTWMSWRIADRNARDGARVSIPTQAQAESAAQRKAGVSKDEEVLGAADEAEVSCTEVDGSSLR